MNDALDISVSIARNCPRGGRPPKDDRLMLEAMICRIRIGCPWRDLPGYFGSWRSVYTRWRRWNRSGI
ncbi:MAG: transposase [Verrucomicrobia bacterium]|nr:MAG: transposase [Verrucomicrobiota bacterium]